MYEELNEKNIINSLENHKEDLTLSKKQLINKYYYMCEYDNYINLFDSREELIQEQFLNLVQAIDAWFKNKIYLRGTKGSSYKTPTWVATHIKGYNRGLMGNKLKTKKIHLVYMNPEDILKLEEKFYS